jgi:methanogenic corrinoid protein MtbC1
MESIEELLKRLHDSVVNFDEEKVKEAAEAFLSNGYDPLQGILHGVASGMQTVGGLFKSQEYFVPEVLLCADAMKIGLDILRSQLTVIESKCEGTIIIGTVQGDIHDLGKNIVKMMLEIGGFTVHDLGTNVPHEKFVDELLRCDADLIGLSAMMTTSMMGMKTVIQKVKAAKSNVGVLIGGAPVNRDIVKLFKADGYSVTAADVVDEAKRVFAQFR